MKKTVLLITFTVLVLVPQAFTQWSDETNKFTDSLHMPVCLAASTQQGSLVIKSYPDSGYFVIWQDQRNYASTKTDIYAQKYDKNGVALWAADGVPVASGTNEEHFLYPFNGNYRNYSVAATDSAGGLYVTWTDDSVSTYYWGRIVAQNILSDGSRLIPGIGLIVAQTPSGQNFDYSKPQLIADGRGGFYISFCRNELGSQQVYCNNYKKQGGSLLQNGGGWLNQYARETQTVAICGIQNTVIPQSTTVNDYFIWPDGEGGCNIVMNMSANANTMIGFNRVVRVKKACTTTVLVRTTDIANCSEVVTNYAKDDVTVLYKFRMFSNTVFCSQPGPPPVAYSVLSTYIENSGMGFLLLDNTGYDCQYVKGVTLSTDGNINTDVIGYVKRMYTNNELTKFTTRVFSRPVEKYDSIPYELASNVTNCYTAIRNFPEGKTLDKFNYLIDTVLGSTGQYYYDFSIAGGGNNVYVTALIWSNATISERWVYLQNLKLVRASADSFALQYNTPSKEGVVIGKEISTGFQGNSITYDNPMIFMDKLGNALFMIRDYYRYTRISPIINSVELAWGAMGKPTGSGIYGSSLYRPENPFIYMNPLGGTAILSWEDERYPPMTGANIYMRHLDSLDIPNHTPTNKPVAALSFGNIAGTPSALLGTSKKYSLVEGYNSTAMKYSPVVEILDNYNLGVVEVGVYTNLPTIRYYNGKPYLDRNFTIKVQNNPAGAATINVRLYFTNAEFDALKAADATIVTPANLAVIKQASSFSGAPATYTPVAGEEVLTPKSWAAVPGGYYIELEVTSFSNFFILKNDNALPVTWVDVQAKWQNSTQARVSWKVADEVNVLKYVIQFSKDGQSFADACTIEATNSTNYHCIVPAYNDGKNYYRVMELDIDGNKSYSKVVLLSGNATDKLITLYPNPANKVLNIQVSMDIQEITIIDAQGRNIAKYRLQNRITTIDVTRFAKGIYNLLLIDNKGAKYYRKFVVE